MSLLLALLGCSCGPRKTMHLLVVLDTVRADHTSLCGYERPTTPVLQRLAAEGSHACDMKTPGNWTVPTHASFFTGLHVVEHGAGLGRDRSEVRFGVRPLPAEGPTTLAERYREQGFATLLVSANGLVGEKAGLARGFDQHYAWQPGDALRDGGIATKLDAMLGSIEGERLFVVVNIIDAHDPWVEVPDGLGWVPPRAPLEVGPFRRFYERTPRVSESHLLRLEHYVDLYDHGVFQADRSLDAVLGVLRERRWLDEDWRMVITSDHGEFLGEHRRLLHNGPELFEEVVSVPVVYVDHAGNRPALPERFSGVGIHDLVLKGALGDSALDVRAAHLSRTPEEKRSELPCGDVSLAVWEKTRKRICAHGELVRYDLALDPREEQPVPMRLDEALAADVVALETLSWSEMEASSATEQLQELGYVE